MPATTIAISTTRILKNSRYRNNINAIKMTAFGLIRKLKAKQKELSIRNPILRLSA
jgi:hypothetical protein